MSSNWFTNLDLSRYSDFFNADELESLYKKVMKRLEEENKKTKNDDVESYSHYDKKVYKDNELVDHVEKEYKNGECIKDIHGHCDKPCCVEHKCCEDKKECCSKHCQHKEDGYKDTWEELRSKNESLREEVETAWTIVKERGEEIVKLKNMLRDCKQQKEVLENKLNKIKNIF